MKTGFQIIADHLPPGSAALLRPCVCGHDRYKHDCFERECREAGCGCEWFGEAANTPSLHNSNTPTNPAPNS
ncbi:MAG: hypothetical protein NT105_23825 [Verrucomicrobia bacterium]|nr:hypothetical protein [Verrucomicrobiota bacterium]